MAEGQYTKEELAALQREADAYRVASGPKLDSKQAIALLNSEESLDRLVERLGLTGRAGSKVKRADGLVRVEGDDIFHRGNKLIDLGGRMDDLRELQDTINEYKADGLKPKVIEKVYDRRLKAITKDGKKIFRDFGKALDYHDGAIAALEKESMKVQADLLKAMDKEFKALDAQQRTASEDGLKVIKEKIDKLKERHTTLKDAIQDHFDTLKEPHENVISELKATVKEIEEVTGLSASEHMGRKSVAAIGSETAKAAAGAMTEAEYASKTGFFDKLSTDIHANATKAGGWGKIKVGVGAIGVVDGVRRIIDGASGMSSTDPEKQAKAGLGTLVTGVGEVVLAGAVARAGGKNAALGKTTLGM